MLKTVLRCICAAFGALLIINGICLILFANSTIGSYLTLLLGLIFLIPSLFLDKTIYLLKKYTAAKLTAALIMFFFSITVIATAFLALYGTSDNVTYTEDYLIVLGCGVRGEIPTEPLRSRLDTAIEYIGKNENCKIILSGGQGNGEDISEAEAMRRYLTEHGIDEKRLILESESTSTTENFRYSNKLVDGGLSSYEVAFITNDFHIYRAYNLARIQGYYFNHLHADTSWYNLAPSYLREMLAIMQMAVFKY